MFPHGMPAQFPDFSVPGQFGQQGVGNGSQGGASSSGQGGGGGSGRNTLPGQNAHYPIQGGAGF
jgi:hypothetical protein